MCNMSYRREFCGLPDYLCATPKAQTTNEARFKQVLVDLVYADLKSIIEFGGFKVKSLI